MIEQYLSYTNESATVSFSQKFSELDKAKSSPRAKYARTMQADRPRRQHVEEENSVETANNYQDNRIFKCLQCRPSNQLDFYMEGGKKSS